jgi:hypothetical protein
MSALGSSWGGYCTGKPVATEERKGVVGYPDQPCPRVANSAPEFLVDLQIPRHISRELQFWREHIGPAHQETTDFVE